MTNKTVTLKMQLILHALVVMKRVTLAGGVQIKINKETTVFTKTVIMVRVVLLISKTVHRVPIGNRKSR